MYFPNQRHYYHSISDPILLWPLPGSGGYDDCIQERTVRGFRLSVL
jgi:hypothetical protein